ncbi:CRISPR-associated protein [Desulfonema limicola]|uniref:CRISPR-associated endonuclease Cas1 n=1 Tax=Desulfonema limicola TaxID=45656 RepID=A0A975B933_9BACT|nr:CRISPR-associated protein [Desulfonema limicola]
MIPVSYLNAYVYCPRRFFLEHNQGMFEDNAHTVEGRSLHRVVDGKDPARASKKGDAIHRRSVSFSSMSLGITGKLDLLEEKEGSVLYPVEYKKSKKPPKDRQPWLNDQIQVCAQSLLMAENGLPMPEKAYIYYIGSKARVEVSLSESLLEQTKQTIAQCRLISRSDILPPLADNRNKCFGCSLNAICLPEEEDVSKGRKTNARTIIPMSMDGDILYVDTTGAYLNLSSGSIIITAPGGMEIGNASIEQLREIVLFGNVQTTTQVLHTCMKNNIPVHYLNFYGRYVGTCSPMLHYNGLLREAQWKAHFDKLLSFEYSKIIVFSKLVNMRTLMMRYLREKRTDKDLESFESIKSINKQVMNAENIQSLRGYEGYGAKIYFSRFGDFIKPEKQSFFKFSGRNRRPPRDPANALLSFGYSLLAKDCTGTAIRVGFDPFCGFYHVMKYGRPSLALDIMEFFRQPIVDSMVLTAVNNGVFRENDFYQFQNTCYLNEKGRKKFLVQYEMRKRDMITHPKFHYRLSYERTIELQFRLLGKSLLNEIDNYEGFSIR